MERIVKISFVIDPRLFIAGAKTLSHFVFLDSIQIIMDVPNLYLYLHYLLCTCMCVCVCTYVSVSQGIVIFGGHIL